MMSKSVLLKDVPDGWDKKPLPSCVDKSSIPRDIKILQSEYLKSGKYPIIDQGAEFVAGFTDDESKLYKGNLPVVVFGDHTRVLKYVDFQFSLGADGTKLLCPKSFLVPKYFYYYLLHVPLESKGYNRHYKYLKEKEIIFPKKSEQGKVAFVLSEIHRAIEQQEQIIAKTKELKRSLMHRLFTYGLRGEELKETEIGLMPENWEVFSISQKCLVKGSTAALTELPLLDTKNTQHELVHGIKVSDMNTVGNEKSINRANIIAHLSKQDAIKKAVPRNSIVFPKRGAAISTNKKRLTTSWTVLDPNLIAIIPNEDIDAEYLYYWFLIFDLRSIQDPGPTPQLNKKDVNPIRFPCPSVEEQKQISSFLSIIDSRHSLSEQKKNCFNELFKSMLQLLMTGQVRVKDIDFGEDYE